jgi:hypothetical protein
MWRNKHTSWCSQCSQHERANSHTTTSNALLSRPPCWHSPLCDTSLISSYCLLGSSMRIPMNEGRQVCVLPFCLSICLSVTLQDVYDVCDVSLAAVRHEWDNSEIHAWNLYANLTGVLMYGGVNTGLYWGYLIVLWLFHLVCILYCGFLTCFVMCGCFDNTCMCIHCVFYCLYCDLFCLIYVYLFLFVLSVLM